jgi:hypothetical protein
MVRLVVLTWLWYQLRPTSLWALLRTMLAMRTLRLTFGSRDAIGSAAAGAGAV